MALTEEQKIIIDDYLIKNNYKVIDNKLFNNNEYKLNFYEGHNIYNLAYRIRTSNCLIVEQDDVIDYICKKNNLSLTLQQVRRSHSSRKVELKKKKGRKKKAAAATSPSTRPNQASANRMQPPNGGVAKPSRSRVARRSDPNPEPLDGFSHAEVVRISEVLNNTGGNVRFVADLLTETSRRQENHPIKPRKR